MTFHNVRLDEDVERDAQGGPGFSTSILTLSSGFEKRNIDWERSRGQWDLSYGLDRKARQEEVLAFFYARQGRAIGFRFKDWTDYQIGQSSPSLVPQEIAVADGAQTQFQIVRRYTSGAFVFDRAITRPVAGTVRVFEDSTEVTLSVSVNNDTGVVTFFGAPSINTSIRVLCEFDVPVRFDIDQLDLRAVRDDVFSFPSVPIIELRESLATLS